jgi:uncharacterized phage protein (TIGR01671 family)
MKEIKFRAWDKHKRAVCSLREFDPCIIVQEGCFTIYQGEDCDFEFMQYTGLKDMNGKDIYEDDIIECFCKYHDGEKYIVNYEDGGFYPFADNDDGIPYVKSEECEVVGNIHENKEELNYDI